MTEARFTNSWIRKFKKRNPDAYVAKMMIPTKAGFPDILIIQRGRPAFVEVKYCAAPPSRKSSKILKHKITQLQWHELQTLQEAGASCHILIGVNGVGERLYKVSDYTLEQLNDMTLGEFKP